MTYAELVTQIQAYTQNDEATFVSQIPFFVKKAEQRIFDQTQLLVARRNATTTTTINVAYVQAPTDFLAPYSMAIISAGQYIPLLFTDETFMREVYPVLATVGIPQHYALFDQNTFIVGPTPDSSAYTVELHYFYYPESIVTASTTWLGTNAENALLYGSLLEAYRFMKGEADIMASTQAHYDASMDGLKLLSAGRDRGDAYRYGQFKVEPQA